MSQQSSTLAMPPGATASHAITRNSASNLALAFVLLPREKRRAMAVLYAFCRQVDDVADEQPGMSLASRQARLDEWRQDLAEAYADRIPRLPVVRELQPILRQFRLPPDLFEELLEGVEMDLAVNRYRTFAELELYCYRVASVVGLLSIEIFGYRDSRCRDYAVSLGHALQLTNILRDVRVDADRDRIYLPIELLEAHRVDPGEILRHQFTERYAALAAAVAQRARACYSKARQCLPPADRPRMVAAELMGTVYWHLLLKLERRNFDVFGTKPVRLNRLHKLTLILGAWRRHILRSHSAAYGDPTRSSTPSI